jgi:hypothetical protein
MELTSAASQPLALSRSGHDGSVTTPSQGEVIRRIGGLTALTAVQLRAEWRRLYRYQPPRLSRDLLIRSLAYRMQELTYGGLSKATQRKLTALIKSVQTNDEVSSDPNPRVRPGARLVREWRGRIHTVVVTDDGFEYSGNYYSSLSKIAQAITGTHWSGPRFFGLNRSEASTVQSVMTAEIGERT